MKQCNHLLGHLCDEFVNVDNIVELTTDVARSVNSIWTPMGKPSISALDIIDQRSGYFRRFKYCSDCGELLNWKEIKKQFK